MIDIYDKNIWAIPRFKSERSACFTSMNFAELNRLLQEICTACDKSSTLESDQVLHHFSIVGARLWPDGTIDAIDGDRILDTFKLLLCAGFAISPEFVLDIVNMKDGRDFFEETHPTDVVVLCGLNDPELAEKYRTTVPDYQILQHQVRLQKTRDEIEQKGALVRDPYWSEISPHAHEQNAWRNLIAQRGIKVVLNEDVGLHPTRLYGSSHIAITLSYYDPLNEFHGFDITGDRKFLKNITPLLAPNDKLARIIQRVLQAAAPRSAGVSVGKPVVA